MTRQPANDLSQEDRSMSQPTTPRTSPELDAALIAEWIVRGFNDLKGDLRTFSDRFTKEQLSTLRFELKLFHRAALNAMGGFGAVENHENPTANDEKAYRVFDWGSGVLQAFSEMRTALDHGLPSREGKEDERTAGIEWGLERLDKIHAQVLDSRPPVDREALEALHDELKRDILSPEDREDVTATASSGDRTAIAVCAVDHATIDFSKRLAAALGLAD